MECDLGWLIGRSLVEVFFHDPASWIFRFGDATEIQSYSPWRLIAGGRIVLSSEDHSQWYGLSQPIDAGHECHARVGGAVVRNAEGRSDTRDIVINFDSGDRLEIISLSSGYESWQIAAPGGVITIAQGGGNLAAWRPDA